MTRRDIEVENLGEGLGVIAGKIILLYTNFKRRNIWLDLINII